MVPRIVKLLAGLALALLVVSNYDFYFRSPPRRSRLLHETETQAAVWPAADVHPQDNIPGAAAGDATAASRPMFNRATAAPQRRVQGVAAPSSIPEAQQTMILAAITAVPMSMQPETQATWQAQKRVSEARSSDKKGALNPQCGVAPDAERRSLLDVEGESNSSPKCVVGSTSLCDALRATINRGPPAKLAYAQVLVTTVVDGQQAAVSHHPLYRSVYCAARVESE